jgi:hypothetical protein
VGEKKDSDMEKRLASKIVASVIDSIAEKIAGIMCRFVRREFRVKIEKLDTNVLGETGMKVSFHMGKELISESEVRFDG